ncbi:MAG: DNA-binding protein [Bryobacteraceae bacterium]
MTRSELQQIAEIRLADAEALLAAGRWAGAYYLLGYVIECALKASIVARFGPEEIPDKKLVNDFYTHRLDGLLKISPIGSTLESRMKADGAFLYSWNLVSDWSEASRYDPEIGEDKARALHIDVTDEKSGIFTWLKPRC